MGKFYITTPIYYVNDKPHIGHAYTTVAADVLARYHRAQGDDVFFLTGTDEHGDKVAASALAQNREVQDFVDENAAAFRQAFAELNVSFDVFMRTTLPSHAEGVHKFMDRLYKSGALYKGTYEGLYCRGCEDFYLAKDLVDNLCPVHQTAPEQVKEDNWFFALEQYIDRVKELIETNQLVVEPATRRQEVLGLIKQGLKDFSVTRQRVRWGIPFPYEEGQTIYVWVEALMNYITAVGLSTDEEEFNHWWPADVHLMAKDIIKFHAVYWPAMLLAAGLPLPKMIFAHGFFTLNGQKMSKTLGNVINPQTLVDRFGVDATRFLLLGQYHFGQDGDIREQNLNEQYTARLVNGLGNLVARVEKMIEQYAGGRIDRSVKPDAKISELVKRYHQELKQLKLYGAASTIQLITTALDEDIDLIKPWALAKADQAAVAPHLSRWTASLLALADLVEPFMPETGAAMRRRFSADRIVKGEPLFPRLAG